MKTSLFRSSNRGNFLNSSFQQASPEDIADRAEQDTDPFGVGVQGKRNHNLIDTLSQGDASVKLPPRMEVRYKIQENISSMAIPSHESEGASETFIKGTVYVQVTSSDARTNAPFAFSGGSKTARLVFHANEEYVKSYSQGSKAMNVVKIPKNVVRYVPIGTYTLNERIAHMPLLLERKVTRLRNQVQVAIQVRTKLTNNCDLTDVTISVSVADPLVSRTIEFMEGNGDFDEMKRSATWRKELLAKGDSWLVEMRGEIHNDVLEQEETTGPVSLSFPVVLRAHMQEKISGASFEITEASGHPASLTSSSISETCCLIHHLK